jgi:hypothetical protein
MALALIATGILSITDPFRAGSPVLVMNIGLSKPTVSIGCAKIENNVIVMWVGRVPLGWEARCAFSNISAKARYDLGIE